MSRVRTHKNVNHIDAKDIINKVNALIKKYGFNEVRLVSLNIFTKGMKKQQLQNEIKARERELAHLKLKSI